MFNNEKNDKSKQFFCTRNLGFVMFAFDYDNNDDVNVFKMCFCLFLHFEMW